MGQVRKITQFWGRQSRVLGAAASSAHDLGESQQLRVLIWRWEDKMTGHPQGLECGCAHTLWHLFFCESGAQGIIPWER